jgi:hypothetical protein
VDLEAAEARRPFVEVQPHRADDRHAAPLPGGPVDYSAEPATLIVFELEEVAGGTQLKVVESDFDRIPLARRAEAFKKNDEGWGMQLKNIERHVTEGR